MPRERRRVVGQVQAVWGVSQRRAIRWTGFPRSTIRYRTQRAPQMELRERIKALAGQHVRWGYRMIHSVLVREGWGANRKRVQRMYREEGLAVRRKSRRRRSQRPRFERQPLGTVNERWSMDFVSDTLSSGRRFRCLTVVDEFSREGLAVHPAYSLPSTGVIQVLERLREERGLPNVLVVDNGPEFTSRAFDAWAYSRGVTIEFIRPGKPVDNCFVERFNGTLRDECLNQHWFLSLDDARQSIGQWREDYNSLRPHSSLGRMTPTEFGEESRSEEVDKPPLQVTQRVPLNLG